MKVRPYPVLQAIYSLCFNSRTREGATGVLVYLVQVWTCFNSRTREGATLRCRKLHPVQSFNSRTREGATRRIDTRETRVFVSIHAPVKVRHKYWYYCVKPDPVSIHAPVKVRHKISREDSALIQVSIHAPVKVRQN